MPIEMVEIMGENMLRPMLWCMLQLNDYVSD